MYTVDGRNINSYFSMHDDNYYELTGRQIVTHTVLPYTVLIDTILITTVLMLEK